jgi:uncharacterized membrane protein YeaQ/YmgE (transglycosylase-associated protein family)
MRQPAYRARLVSIQIVVSDRTGFAAPDPGRVTAIAEKGKRKTMHGFIWWIVVGVIAGWLTGKIMSGEGYGFFVDMIVGIIGAFVGGFLMTHLGFAGQGGLIYSIFVAVIGAVIFTFLLRLVTGGRVQQV